MTCRVAVRTCEVTVVLCGSSSLSCVCRCPASCDYVWGGEELIYDARGRVVGATTVCARCGISAADHDLRVLP